MLRNLDRFAPPAARTLRVGQFIRMPLALGEREVYRHRWQIVAFPIGQSATNSPGLAHCCIVRRLADGLTKTVAQHWVTRYND